MARFRGAKGKIVRRFGINIFGNNKYDKVLEKKPYGPGQAGQNRRRKVSVYGKQLVEKQKVKYMYGVLEKQFRRYYKNANRQMGKTGENLIKILERRLDNVIYRMHFAVSRDQARQLVLHKHVMVNGQIVNIPSYQLKEGDVISLKEKSKKLKVVLEALKDVSSEGVAPWLQVDADKCEGSYKIDPRREDIPDLKDIDEQLIVELYSK